MQSRIEPRLIRERVSKCLVLLIGLAFATCGQWELRALVPDASSRTGYWLTRTWTTEDGLPGSDVTGIVRTPDGYLWDSERVNDGSARSVTFQDLAPGTFRFTVTAANTEGIWNETGASLDYAVLPTFSQSNWFRGLIGVLLAGEAAILAGLFVSHQRSIRLRNELHEEQERWDMASAAAKLGLWTWDIASNEFWANENAFALLGQSPSEPATFEQVMEAQHPDDRETTRKALKRALNREHDYDTEFRVKLPNQETRWLAARGVVDFDAHGTAARLRGVWIDLTVRKSLEIEASGQRAALAHMGRVAMMSELSGSLAHELNQPLSAILTNAQAAQHYLDRKTLDKAELAEILVDILGEVRRAGEVIRRMRTMLRKGAAEFEPVDMNKVVVQVLALIHSDLVARSVTVVTQLAPCLPLVRGDAVQIQQVLLNLIVNGCDAMHDVSAPDRELRIETEQDGPGQLSIMVADRGSGLSGDMLEKIFEPFMTTKTNGLGMGLALCRSIVTAHGGRIWAARNEGPGLTVSFTLKAISEGEL